MEKISARIVALIMAVIMIVSLAGCGSKSGTGSNETTAAEVKGTESKADSTSSGDDEDTIKIGVMLQLSGSSPATSQEDLIGVQIIADIINNATEYNLPLADTEGLPNLGGKKVEIVVGDAATNDAAMSECERLITEEGVQAFCGVLGSSGVKIAATAFEKYGVPYVTNASSTTLTTSGYEYLARIFPDDKIYCEGAFSMIKELNETENAGIKTVALCSEDSEFGANITKIEKELAEEYGLEIVETVSYSASATNVTSEVLQLKNANADVVMMSSYTADAILFMQTFKEQNYMPKMLCAQRGGFSYNEIFTSLGEDVNYVFNSSPWAADLDVPNAQLMADLYAEASNGGVLQEGCMRIMTDFYAACLAINQAGSSDADAIMEEFRTGIEIPDDQKWLSIDIKVDENGQNLESSSLVMQAFDGAYKIVYPTDVASEDYVYPIPGWDER